MELVQDKNKRTGLIGTVLFHGLLLLLFLILGLKYMVPPPEEEGITINFGTSNEGMGNEQPITPVVNDNQTEDQNTETATNQVPTDAVQEVVTQDVEETVKLKSEKTQEVVKKEPEEVKPQPSKELSKLIDQLKNKSGSNSGSEGETGKPGDQGRLDGDPNSKNRDGLGKGNGGYSLEGRSVKYRPTINDNSQEEGTVVVEIVVDRSGNVIRATPGVKPSTTTNPHLYKIAKEAALKAKFDTKNDAAFEQKGTITFIFKLN